MHALGLHLCDTTIQQVFLQLEIGNAVAHQASNPVAFFVHRHVVAYARQLLGTGQPRWAGTDDSDAFAGFLGGHLGNHPTFCPAFVDNGVFNGFDTDRDAVDIQGTGGLAGSGADAAGNFRKVVGGVQHVQRFFPLLAVHQIIPVGNDVVDRAAVVAEGHTAIHAAGRLLTGLFVIQYLDKLFPVLDPL